MRRGFFIAAILAFVTQAAIGGSIMVEPQRVVLHDADRALTITLLTNSDHVERYSLSLIDMAMSDTGQITPVGKNVTVPGSLKAAVAFSPTLVTLRPGRPQTVRIFVSGANDLGPGEYRSHLLISERPTPSPPVAEAASRSAGQTDITVKTLLAISIPVIYRRGPGSVKVTAAPDVKISNGAIAIALHRTGEWSSFGDISILGKDNFPIALSNGVAIYNTVADARVSIPLLAGKSSPKSGDHLTIKYVSRPGVQVLVNSAVIVP